MGGTIESKRFNEPDEVVTAPLVSEHGVVVGETYVARIVHEPGWRWSEHVKDIVGTASCQHHHQGVVLSGRLEVVAETGARRVMGPGEVYDVSPGHDAWVVGDEAAVVIEFAGVRGWAKSPETGERVLATLLVTDIVGSTEAAARLGDAAWKRLLGRHLERARRELDRYRGIPVAGTGDGILALFDGAARAVRCAAALVDAAAEDGLAIRAGVHSGEVERQAENVRGIAVHAATRVAGAAGPGDVLVSEATGILLEGSGLQLEPAGEHELKGLPGPRALFRLADGG
jgi:class 3 adenylate cyclase